MKTAASSYRRRLALLGAVAAGATALSGCQINSPTTTLLRYAPADGIEMDGQALAARDILVVSHGDGAPGVVSGTLFNSSDEPLTVAVSVGGQSAGEVTVEPRSPYRLDGVTAEGGEAEPTKVSAVETPAGVGVEVAFDANGDKLSGVVPVLLPQGVYEGFADDAGGTAEPRAEDTADH